MRSADKSGIHIVSFDVPFPTNYGGVIDVFHRCKSLRATGVKVILHCFEYGRGKPNELNEIADEVYFYPREKSLKKLFSKLPYIVCSRNSKNLLENLEKDNFPIVFEGIHTCFFLNHSSLKNRWKGVRAHNVEHDYYQELAKIERNWLKKAFFWIESRKLKRFEAVFDFADEILTVTPKDNIYFQQKYGKGEYLPVFNPLNWGEKEQKTENYALFHGNLSVMENEFAFRFITDKIWSSDMPLKLMVAGKDPSKKFVDYLQSLPFEVKCIPNPDNETLNQLIRNAKINLLPTFQSTGIKHKLLNCLANGGYCLANTTMVEGTGLEEMCMIANSVDEWKNQLKNSVNLPENTAFFLHRKKTLRSIFDLDKNAKRIMEIVANQTNNS